MSVLLDIMVLIKLSALNVKYNVLIVQIIPLIVILVQGTELIYQIAFVLKDILIMNQSIVFYALHNAKLV